MAEVNSAISKHDIKKRNQELVRIDSEPECETPDDWNLLEQLQILKNFEDIEAKKQQTELSKIRLREELDRQQRELTERKMQQEEDLQRQLREMKEHSD